MPYILLLVSASLLSAQSGELRIYMLEHAIGHEHYEIKPRTNSIELNTTIEFTDRINRRSTSATLQMTGDYTPVQLAIKDKPNSVAAKDGRATVAENGTTRTSSLPRRFFTIFDEAPFAVQAMMFRYWDTHGKPDRLPILRGNASAETVQIQHVGRIAIKIIGKSTTLDRYTVANLAFGREVVWIDPEQNLIVAMTFAGGLPMKQCAPTTSQPLLTCTETAWPRR